MEREASMDDYAYDDDDVYDYEDQESDELNVSHDIVLTTGHRSRAGHVMVRQTLEGDGEFVLSAMVQERCCGGGKRVLQRLRRLFMCGRRHTWGNLIASYTAAIVTFVILSLPVIGLLLYVSLREGSFLGAFSIFAIPPLLFIHLKWYFRRPRLESLFDEITLYGPTFSRKAERVLRRHVSAFFVVVPCLAVVTTIMLFATNPLKDVADATTVKRLQITIIPFFLLSLLTVGVVVCFATCFSTTWELTSIVVTRFATLVEHERPTVKDTIHMHKEMICRLADYTSHWRVGYTIATILSLSGIFLIFYMVSIAESFLRVLLPFATWLMFCCICLQMYFFWSIRNMHKQCQSLQSVLARYEMSLPTDSVERLLLSIHASSHKPSFMIFGFTGVWIIDVVFAIGFTGIFLFLDRLVGWIP